MTDENQTGDLIAFVSPIHADLNGHTAGTTASRTTNHQQFPTATPIKPKTTSSDNGSNLIEFASPNNPADSTANLTSASYDHFSTTYTTDCFSPPGLTNSTNTNHSTNNENNTIVFDGSGGGGGGEGESSALDIIEIIETTDLLNLTTELEENW
jgi:hypothetical protein